MGFRFSKRVSIMPGVSLNFGKRGVSTSIGPRGAKVNISSRGIRQTVGMPGTGLSYSQQLSSAATTDPPAQTRSSPVGMLLIFGLLGVLLISTWLSDTSPPPRARPSVNLAGGNVNDPPELLLGRFGKPTTDTSSARERPRPAIVTRIVTYKAQNVRAIYRADVAVGAAMPKVVPWKLIGFTDPTANTQLRAEDAIRRLAPIDQAK